MEKKPDRSEIIAMTLLFALTLVLTVLKVTRTVSLPWLWVLGPLWLGTYRYRDQGCLRWEISPSVFYSSEMPRYWSISMMPSPLSSTRSSKGTTVSPTCKVRNTGSMRSAFPVRVI